MFQPLKKKTVKLFTKSLKKGVKPLEFHWSGTGSPAVILFDNGVKENGSCVRCYNPPCIKYSTDELLLPIFGEFPIDRNDHVCPTSAILWPLDAVSPIIDPAQCIMCGLCVQRCPVKAIYFQDFSAVINDAPNSIFVEGSIVSSEKNDSNVNNIFKNVRETGVFLYESDEYFKIFLDNFARISNHQVAQFPNHLARNLLIEVGVGAAMRRRGDTNLRMDLLLGPPGVRVGTGEVEFTNEVIDVPRNLLDDVAVLVMRYQISKKFIVPLVVCLSLPNQRSEYWQLLSDIENVLKIKINTITVGGLIILIYNNKKYYLKQVKNSSLTQKIHH
jgi:ferredoxin